MEALMRSPVQAADVERLGTYFSDRLGSAVPGEIAKAEDDADHLPTETLSSLAGRYDWFATWQLARQVARCANDGDFVRLRHLVEAAPDLAGGAMTWFDRIPRYGRALDLFATRDANFLRWLEDSKDAVYGAFVGRKVIKRALP